MEKSFELERSSGMALLREERTARQPSMHTRAHTRASYPRSYILGRLSLLAELEAVKGELSKESEILAAAETQVPSKLG